MKNILTALAFAALTTISTASAAPVYLGIFDGNDNEANVEAAILAATSNAVDIDLYDKSDEAPVLTNFNPNPPGGNLQGEWDVINDSVKISYLTVKASNRFTLYYYADPVNFGDWSTANLLNNNGRQQDLSHLSLWTAENGVNAR